MSPPNAGLALGLEVGFVCSTCGAEPTCVGRYENMEDMEPACDECCGHGCEDGLCHRVEVVDVATWECSCGASGESSLPDRDARAHLIDHLNRYFDVEAT